MRNTVGTLLQWMHGFSYFYSTSVKTLKQITKSAEWDINRASSLPTLPFWVSGRNTLMRNAALQPISIQRRGNKAFASHTCCPFQGFPWWRCVLGCSGPSPRTPRHTCLYPEPRYHRSHQSRKHTVGNRGEILRRFSKKGEKYTQVGVFNKGKCPSRFLN